MKLLQNNPTNHPVQTVDAVRSAKMYIGAAALLSFFLSIALWFSGDREMGLFVGIWVPSILSAGTLLLAGRHHD